MEAYLEKLLTQIRCKKARPYIAEEIRGHIECQIEDNLSGGMAYEEAEKSAVADMGDPVEVGVALDKIHRPQIAWRLLAMMGVISLLGILMQQSILSQTVYSEMDIFSQGVYKALIEGFVPSVVWGFIIMCIIYFIDYTVIGRCSKIIGLLIITIGILLLTDFFGDAIKDLTALIRYEAFRTSLPAIMMFYVPIYGAILYKYRGGGIWALLKSIIWMIAPVFIVFHMSGIIAEIMLISMLIQLTVAILKGWFKIPIKRAVAGLWSVFMLLPIMILFFMYTFHMFQGYQEERIRSFLSASDDGVYITSILRTLCRNMELIGNSGSDVIGELPEVYNDYIFSYILSSYGIIAGILIIAVLATLVLFIFGAAIKQKNELGMVMGFGCGNIILFNLILNVLGAVGAIPPVSSFLPFFSVGRSNILLCYALIGIIMSIYRYKDVYPQNFKRSHTSLKKYDKHINNRIDI